MCQVSSLYLDLQPHPPPYQLYLYHLTAAKAYWGHKPEYLLRQLLKTNGCWPLVTGQGLPQHGKVKSWEWGLRLPFGVVVFLRLTILEKAIQGWQIRADH